ncbi:MAG: hypothetical protein HF978_14225 [Desulfobacteraceae bacterium]|nr:hypothetical protein [Desulfobacteraceae bacterium]MBC2756695.1 hypothetical protein [Desulfobacteraceae bacterium]
MRLGTADVLVRAKTGQYKKDINTAEGKTHDFGKKAVDHVGKVTKSFVLLGSAVVAVSAALGSKTIGLASDLEETQGKFDVVFRGMTASAENWSDTMQAAFAMSETESKKYLSSIQDLLVPTGMLREVAGKLSYEFVKMAADLGSFNNRETSEVVRDIQSALQGSSETMAKYGINVKAAKVEQEAYRLGLAKTKKQITDAHKAQAIYNIIMREGADAVGDMARTSDSYANQQKKLHANINDISTAIGISLLPVATQLTSEFNNWVKTNDELLKQDLRGYAIESATAVSYLIDAGAGLKREFQVAGRVIAVGFQSMQLGAYQFADAIYNAPIRALNAVIELSNKIPKLGDIELLPLTGMGKDVYDRMVFLTNAVNHGLDDITDILTAPLPGTGIRSALEDIGNEVEETEEKIKDSVNKITNTLKKAFDPYEISKAQTKQFMDFMSMDDQANAAKIMHDAAMFMAEDSLFNLDELNREVTRSIHQEWSGLMTDGLTGELDSFKDYFTSFADTLSGIWANRFTANIMEFGWADGFAKMEKDSTMSYLGMAQAAMQAAQSDNQYQMGGTALGMGAGFMFGGPMGAALGGSAGGMLGGLFGGDDEPSYLDLLVDSIDDLIVALEKNTQSILDQVRGTSDLAIAQREMKEGIFKDIIPGQDFPFAEEFRIPEGMKQREGEWYQKFAEPIAQSLGFVPGIGYLAGEYAVKDKGYTAYDFDKSETGDVIGTLWDKLGFVEFYNIMKDSTTNAGALIDALKANKLISPEIPENRLDWYSADSNASVQTEKVAAGIVASLEESFAQIDLIAVGLVENVDQAIAGFDDSKLTDYKKAIKDVEDTLGVWASDAKDLLEVEALLGDASEMSAEQRRKLADVEAEYLRIKTETEAEFADKQKDIYGDISAYIAGFNDQTTALGLTFKVIEEQFSGFEDQLISAGVTSVDLISDIATAKGAAFGAAANDSLSVLTTFFSNREDAGRTPDDWKKVFVNLGKDMASLDSGSKAYYEQSLDIFNQQVSALENMTAGLDEMAIGLAQSSDSIDSMLFDLTGGSLAPVQSKELIHGYYSSLYSTAMQTGDPGAIEKYLSYIPEYLAASTAWGADYANRVDAVTGHLQDLNVSVEEKENATLTQLESINIFSETMSRELEASNQLLGTINQSIVFGFQGLIDKIGNQQIVVDGNVLGDIVADQFNTNTNLMELL